jgi:putative addiction module CopG family antidote
MVQISITLTPELKSFLDAQVAGGEFGSASDYIGLLLSEAQRRDLLTEVEGQLLEGLASPVSPMTGEDWARLRQTVVDRSPELRGT